VLDVSDVEQICCHYQSPSGRDSLLLMVVSQPAWNLVMATKSTTVQRSVQQFKAVMVFCGNVVVMEEEDYAVCGLVKVAVICYL